MGETVLEVFQARTAILSLSACLFCLNVAILTYTIRSKPLAHELRQSRPFTRQAMRFVWLMVLANTIVTTGITVIFMIASEYTIPALAAGAPTWVQWSTVALYCLVYAMGTFPSLLLYWLATTLAEIDEAKRRSYRRQIQREQEIERRRRRSRSQRTNGGRT